MAGLKAGAHQIMTHNNIIDFRGATFGFPGQAPLFTDLSLSIQKGAFYLVKGSSGARKNHISSIDQPP